VTYVALGNILAPNLLFTCLSLFETLRFPMMMLPSTLTEILQLINSLRRIGELLDAEELTDVNQRLPAQESSESTEVGEDDAFELQDGFEAKLTTEALPSLFPSDSNMAIEAFHMNYSWDPTQQEPTLHDISLQIQLGQVCCAIGMVGSGKSSLLEGLLGEMNAQGGYYRIRGKVAYISQSAWIIHASLRENICLGLPYDEQRYFQVIQAAALTQDIQLLPGGHDCEVSLMISSYMLIV